MKKTIAVLALVLGMGCAGSTPPPVVAPTTAPASAAAIAKSLEAVRKIGVVVEQFQIEELALYQGGHVPADVHTRIVVALRVTSGAVLTALDTVNALTTAGSLHALLLTITDNLKPLITELGHLSNTQAKNLSTWLDTAVSLFEVATS